MARNQTINNKITMFDYNTIRFWGSVKVICQPFQYSYFTVNAEKLLRRTLTFVASKIVPEFCIYQLYLLQNFTRES